jgi:hypothetical protein
MKNGYAASGCDRKKNRNRSRANEEFPSQQGKITSETKMTKWRTISALFLRHSKLRKEKRIDIGQLFNSLA